MISFKLFVEAIHHAIVSASDSLMDKNEGLLDKYFEKPVDGEGKNKGALVPKIVQLEYPALDDTGAVTTINSSDPFNHMYLLRLLNREGYCDGRICIGSYKR